MLGRPLFGWQQYVVNVLGEVQSEEAGDPEPGKLAYDQANVFAQRRSGKTVVVHPVVARTCGQPVKRTAWTTAQKGDSARRRWMDTTDVIMASPLDVLVKRKISNSHEELRWVKTGSLYVPASPDDETMHGEDPDLAIVDELWALTLAELLGLQDGYRPAWSVKEGQEILLSAAGVLRSGALKHQRALGREAVRRGRRLGLAHFEWAVAPTIGGVPVQDLEDRELVAAVLDAHPRRDHGLKADWLLTELGKGRAAFLRHYGGIDDDTGSDRAIVDLAKVQAAAAPVAIPVGARIGLAFEVDLDGLEVSLAAGYRWPDGVAQAEAIEQRDGTRWAGPRILELVEKQPIGMVACINAGPSRDLADEIAPRLPEGVELLRLPAGDFAASFARFKTSIEEQQPPDLVRVRVHDPRGELVAAIGRSGVMRWRSGPVPVRRGAEAVTMLPAMAIALWTADRIPDPPKPAKPFRVW